MKGNPLAIFKTLDTELFDNIVQTRELAFTSGHLSLKHKLLIALALDASHGAVEGVKTLAKQALQQGATHGEILDAVRVVRYTSGVMSMYTAALALEDILNTDESV